MSLSPVIYKRLSTCFLRIRSFLFVLLRYKWHITSCEFKTYSMLTWCILYSLNLYNVTRQFIYCIKCETQPQTGKVISNATQAVSEEMLEQLYHADRWRGWRLEAVVGASEVGSLRGEQLGWKEDERTRGFCHSGNLEPGLVPPRVPLPTASSLHPPQRQPQCREQAGWVQQDRMWGLPYLRNWGSLFEESKENDWSEGMQDPTIPTS